MLYLKLHFNIKGIIQRVEDIFPLYVNLTYSESWKIQYDNALQCCHITLWRSLFFHCLGLHVTNCFLNLLSVLPLSHFFFLATSSNSIMAYILCTDKQPVYFRLSATVQLYTALSGNHTN